MDTLPAFTKILCMYLVAEIIYKHNLMISGHSILIHSSGPKYRPVLIRPSAALVTPVT